MKSIKICLRWNSTCFSSLEMWWEDFGLIVSSEAEQKEFEEE